MYASYQQGQFSRENSPQGGDLELDVHDAILAQNQLLTQQLGELTRQMAKLPQQLRGMQQNPTKNHQALICAMCHGNHHTAHCSSFNYIHEEDVNYFDDRPSQIPFQSSNHSMGRNPNYGQGWETNAWPSNGAPLYQQSTEDSERTSRFEDTLNQFMQLSISNQKRTDASIKNLEVQFKQITKQWADQQEDFFSTNTQANPNEHCNSNSIRSGEVFGQGIEDNLDEENIVVEEEENEGKRDGSGQETEKNKNGVESERELELKMSPLYLNHAHTEEEDTTTIIISIPLSAHEDEELTESPEALKEAIGWAWSNVKHISPPYSIHQLDEDDFKPLAHPQHRSNPTGKKIGREEVVKLFEAEMLIFGASFALCLMSLSTILKLYMQSNIMLNRLFQLSDPWSHMIRQANDVNEALAGRQPNFLTLFC